MANKYGAGNDGCVWNPDKDRYVRSDEAHYHEHPATVMLGADDRLHRLCESCSQLPRFARLRSRRPIVKRESCPHPSRQPYGRHEWYMGGGIHPGTASDMYCRACGKVQPDQRKESGA